MSFKSWLHKWKAVGAVFGVSGKTNKAVKDIGNKAKTIADHANKDIGGDPRLDGGYKSNTGETIGDGIGRSIADGEGDEE